MLNVGSEQAGGRPRFARFTAAHLPTDVERAVFWVLAGSAGTYGLCRVLLATPA